MTRRNYQIISAILSMLAAFFGVLMGVFLTEYLAIGLTIMAILVTGVWIYIKKLVDEPIEDERDLDLKGRAASTAISAYLWIVTGVSIVIMGISRDANNFRLVLSMMYPTVILMIIYSLIYRYNLKQKYTDPYLIFIALVLVHFTYVFINHLIEQL